LNSDKRISVGKLGELSFKKGYYGYVGSALNNLSKRIERHKRKEKKIRWHIDYLLNHAKVVGVETVETLKKIECSVNDKVSRVSSEIISSFGSSDCKCKGHLHYFGHSKPEPLTKHQ
jgi:sugar fermentation stimulation protein A